jgi:hypothetical protein
MERSDGTRLFCLEEKRVLREMTAESSGGTALIKYPGHSCAHKYLLVPGAEPAGERGGLHVTHEMYPGTQVISHLESTFVLSSLVVREGQATLRQNSQHETHFWTGCAFIEGQRES